MEQNFPHCQFIEFIYYLLSRPWGKFRQKRAGLTLGWFLVGWYYMGVGLCASLLLSPTGGGERERRSEGDGKRRLCSCQRQALCSKMRDHRPTGWVSALGGGMVKQGHKTCEIERARVKCIRVTVWVQCTTPPSNARGRRAGRRRYTRSRSDEHAHSEIRLAPYCVSGVAHLFISPAIAHFKLVLLFRPKTCRVV